MKHFLKETDFSRPEREEIFQLAREFKRLRNKGTPPSLNKQTWGMLFFKNSTRTRVSFEVGVSELGGKSLFLDKNALQLARGESIRDTANILSRYLHGLIIRAFDHQVLEEFVQEGSVPVINALTDFLHPCQSYTDLFTVAERWAGENNPLLASLKDRKLVFLGDTACNMANSLALAGAISGMEVVLSGPSGYEPRPQIKELFEKEELPPIQWTQDAETAVRGADVVYTDVWVSMGDEAEEEKRLQELRPYSVTAELFSLAKPDAYFLHCMPTHPGQEVMDEVLVSPRAILYDQAENRLHMQKAIMAVLATEARDELNHK